MRSVKGHRAGKQDVTIGQIKRPRESTMIKVVSNRTDDPGLDFDFIRVTIGLGQEEDLLPILGPIRPLPKPGDSPDMRRQMIGRTSLPGGSCLGLVRPCENATG